MPADASPRSANRAGAVASVNAAGSQSATSSHSRGIDTRASGVGRTDQAEATRRVVSDERADAHISTRLPQALKAELEEMAKGESRSLTAQVISIFENYIDARDDSGLGLLTALITAVLADLGPAAAALGAAPSAEATRDWIASSPFAYDQAVQAINVLLEAFRPPGERLPEHLREPRPLPAAPVSGEGPPIEIDFNGQARALGEGAAGLALLAVADPDALLPGTGHGKLRRLGVRIQQRFPDAAERIRANLERHRQEKLGRAPDEGKP